MQNTCATMFLYPSANRIQWLVYQLGTRGGIMRMTFSSRTTATRVVPSGDRLSNDRALSIKKNYQLHTDKKAPFKSFPAHLKRESREGGGLPFHKALTKLPFLNGQAKLTLLEDFFAAAKRKPMPREAWTVYSLLQGHEELVHLLKYHHHHAMFHLLLRDPVTFRPELERVAQAMREQRYTLTPDVYGHLIYLCGPGGWKDPGLGCSLWEECVTIHGSSAFSAWERVNPVLECYLSMGRVEEGYAMLRRFLEAHPLEVARAWEMRFKLAMSPNEDPVASLRVWVFECITPIQHSDSSSPASACVAEKESIELDHRVMSDLMQAHIVALDHFFKTSNYAKAISALDAWLLHPPPQQYPLFTPGHKIPSAYALPLLSIGLKAALNQPDVIKGLELWITMTQDHGYTPKPAHHTLRLGLAESVQELEALFEESKAVIQFAPGSLNERKFLAAYESKKQALCGSM